MPVNRRWRLVSSAILSWCSSPVASISAWTSWRLPSRPRWKHGELAENDKGANKRRRRASADCDPPSPKQATGRKKSPRGSASPNGARNALPRLRKVGRVCRPCAFPGSCDAPSRPFPELLHRRFHPLLGWRTHSLKVGSPAAPRDKPFHSMAPFRPAVSSVRPPPRPETSKPAKRFIFALASPGGPPYSPAFNQPKKKQSWIKQL